MKRHDIAQFNILNITLNGSEIRSRYNLIGNNNEAAIVKVNKVGYNIRLYILEIPINVSDIVT